jgi:hypothetical protein
MASRGRSAQPKDMSVFEWKQIADDMWHYQRLAQFGRRAHAHFGRGFVMVDDEREQPVYVTELLGAPQPLLDAVYSYDPDREALIISEADADDAVTISCIRIETLH